VERLRVQLADQGRPVEGGWPGTISEARRLVLARMAADAKPSTSTVITRARFDQLVKVVYMKARREWLLRAG
jgi:hypothetical protein